MRFGKLQLTETEYVDSHNKNKCYCHLFNKGYSICSCSFKEEPLDSKREYKNGWKELSNFFDWMKRKDKELNDKNKKRISKNNTPYDKIPTENSCTNDIYKMRKRKIIPKRNRIKPRK